MVINQPTTNLRQLGEWLATGFLVVFSTPNPPWGLVDTRHGTGIFGLQKTGGGRCFFFFSGWGWCFCLLGDIFGMSFFGISWCFFLGDFFGCLFWGFLGVVVAAWSVFPKKNSFSLYVFFLFAICQILFFFHLISWIQGGLPAFFLVASTKLRRFSVSSFLRVFFFPSKNHLRDGRNP